MNGTVVSLHYNCFKVSLCNMTVQLHIPNNATTRQCCLACAVQVSSLVHALVGGAVEHIASDEHDLDDVTKMRQRLHSMNFMAREGWEPDVDLWEVGGGCTQQLRLAQLLHGMHAHQLCCAFE